MASSCKKLKRISGFSMIELSLTLVVVGALSIVAIQKYTADKQNQRQLRAYSDLKNIKRAVDEYVSAKRHYPCPASPVLATTDPKFGIGMRSPDIIGDCVADSNFGTLSASFDPHHDRFKNVSTDYTPSGLNKVFNEDVIIGAVPCKDIGLPPDCMFDPFGNRYAFAVIPALARVNACSKYVMSETDRAQDQKLLRIKMLDGVDLDNGLSWSYNHGYSYSGNPPQPDLDPDYAIIYYGSDGFGAYPNFGGGARISPMPIPGSPDSYVGDNAYQEINHNLHSNFDEYFLMPNTPLGQNITFGDVLLFGRSTYLNERSCVACDSICGYGTGGVATVTSFTGCNSAVQDKCQGNDPEQEGN